MDPGKDPYDWTIDEVIIALCHTQKIFSDAGLAEPRLPDLSFFKRQLRDNEITGAVLLDCTDTIFLRDELLIKVAGQRHTLCEAVKHLQRQSAKYTEKKINDHPAFINSHSGLTAGYATPGLRSFSGPAPSIQSHSPYSHDATIDAACFVPPIGSDLVATGMERPHEVPLQAVNEGNSHTGEKYALNESLGNTVNVRNGEKVVIDQQGRKRRKITHLASTMISMDAGPAAGNSQWPLPEMIPFQGKRVEYDSLQLSQPNANYGGEDRPVKRLASKTDDKKTFMGPALTVDELFFGNIPLGGLMMDEEEEGEFSFVSIATPGKRHYVNRQIFHFLRNTSQKEIRVQEKPAIALYPYREALVPMNRIRSAMVFQDLGTDVRVTREDPLRLNSDIREDDPSKEENSNHDWDFLCHWTYGSRDELPTLGESDSELGYSPSFIEEIEAENREEEASKAKKRKGPLDSQEVLTIVDQAMQDVREMWQKKKLPLRQSTAWKIWKEGRRAFVRYHHIDKAKGEIQKLNERLQVLKREISEQIWSKPKDVLRQCAILDESINQQEEQKWRLSVWQSKVEPPRLKAKPPTRKMIPSIHDSDSEGIDLGSESEVIVDDLAEFIDIEKMDVASSLHQALPFESNSLPRASSESPESKQSPPRELSVEYRDIDRPTETEDSVLGVDVMDIDDDEESASQYTASQNGETPRSARSPTSTSIIDLTFLSDAEPSEEPTTPTTPKIPDSLRFNGHPEDSSDAVINSWTWAELEERGDRKRIVIKIIRELSPKVRDMMAQRIKKLGKGIVIDEIRRAIGVLMSSQERIQGYDHDDSMKAFQLTKLYGCWNQCRYSIWTDGINQCWGSSILEGTTRSDLNTFYAFVHRMLLQPPPNNTQAATLSNVATPSTDTLSRRLPNGRATRVNVDLSNSEIDDSDEMEVTPSRGKRKVHEKSQAAIAKREKALRRRQDQEEMELQLSQKIGQDVPGDGKKIIINTSKDDSADFIYINEFIGSRIKKHQIEGVRFMWREVVKAGQTESQGCLLAHTMGLGKTMQTITLVVTIAEAASSRNKAVRKQIPQHLRPLRTLIICPASLVLNWVDEIKLWMPPTSKASVGKIRSLLPDTTLNERLKAIETWSEQKGILIMSYHLLRNLTDTEKLSGVAAERAKNVRDQLLNGPSLIIADEAHALNNPHAAISKLCELFNSRSRIALTGSPLANQLMEYFSMINWISAGYLGDRDEFHHRFQKPIQQGLYIDSTKYEQRLSLKKLRVLMSEIEPKVHRADITVLEHDLHPKTEFLITLPLTELQRQAYEIFIESIYRGGAEIATSYVWTYVEMLTLLCNHPLIFFNKLFEKQPASNDGQSSSVKLPSTDQACAEKGQADRKEGSALEGQNAPESPAQTYEDQPVKNLGVSESMILEQQALLEVAKQGLVSINISYKMEAVNKILDHALEANDRTLIFSQSIRTLNFLEDAFRRDKRRYKRIDGSTKSSSRQTTTKEFNQIGSSTDVFLISTRAGGVGLNLPGANRVIIVDVRWNPQHEQQAIGRAYRIGQKKPVFVYRLIVGGTFEEAMHNLSVFKTQLSFKVVDNKNVEGRAERAKHFLFPPEAVEQDDLSEHVGKDPDVLDHMLKDEAVVGFIRSIDTSETLQREMKEKLTEQEEEEVRQMKADEKLRRNDPLAWRARQTGLSATAIAANTKVNQLIVQAQSAQNGQTNTLNDQMNATLRRQMDAFHAGGRVPPSAPSDLSHYNAALDPRRNGSSQMPLPTASAPIDGTNPKSSSATNQSHMWERPFSLKEHSRSSEPPSDLPERPKASSRRPTSAPFLSKLDSRARANGSTEQELAN